MRNLKALLAGAVVLVALAATVGLAAEDGQATTPAAGPALCSDSSPAQAEAPLPGEIAQAEPQAVLPCIAYGICQSCPDGTAKPCLVVQCGTQKTANCGSCTPDCVPPDF